MTRRDFQLIARTLKEARTPAGINAPRAHVESNALVLALAKALAGTNPKFDHDRFVSASGGIIGPAPVL